MKTFNKRRAAAFDDVPPDERIGSPLLRPGLRIAHHRSTTRHLASMYPCQVDPGLGPHGVIMGTDLETGTPFHHDPFELYTIVGNISDLISRRTHMVTALVAGILERPLHQIEESTLGWAIETDHDTPALPIDVDGRLAVEHAFERSGDEPFQCESGISTVLKQSPSRGTGAGDHFVGWFAEESDDVSERRRVLPLVGDDLSGVTNTKEQPLLMIAATGWLQQLLATPESDTVPRRYQVLEEIWALLGNPHVARYQAS
jgi:hypothetical protein